MARIKNLLLLLWNYPLSVNSKRNIYIFYVLWIIEVIIFITIFIYVDVEGFLLALINSREEHLFGSFTFLINLPFKFYNIQIFGVKHVSILKSILLIIRFLLFWNKILK